MSIQDQGVYTDRQTDRQTGKYVYESERDDGRIISTTKCVYIIRKYDCNCRDGIIENDSTTCGDLVS